MVHVSGNLTLSPRDDLLPNHWSTGYKKYCIVRLVLMWAKLHITRVWDVADTWEASFLSARWLSTNPLVVYNIYKVFLESPRIVGFYMSQLAAFWKDLRCSWYLGSFLSLPPLRTDEEKSALHSWQFVKMVRLAHQIIFNNCVNINFMLMMFQIFKNVKLNS